MRTLGLTACFALLLLAAAAPAVAQSDEHPAPALLPAPEDALTDALEAGELTEAEYALERARSAFQLGSVRREFGDVERPGGHDATLLLRDLALRQDELSGADRTVAKGLLARPNGGGVPYGNGWTSPEAANSPACLQPDVDLCVHWVDADGDPDAPEAVDDDPFNGVPDYVDLALVTLETVWAHEIGALGYRPPLDDAGSPTDGGSGFDVYLDDLGGDGLFGYCTSDDPERTFAYSVSAYCVLDNDYSSTQFGTAHTANEFLEVTSAHELHHASQFAYDWFEDEWLMEGTATNMEEEVFPAINDNVNFLEQWSPLTRPTSPLDRSGSGGSAYGSWIFWRFLQEKVAGGDPAIVREIWERADATLRDDYSLQAVQKEVAQRGLPFVDAFVRFGVANRLLNYADAKSAGYPATPSTGSWYLGPSRPATSWQSWRIDHLATRFFSFAPGVGVARDARLRLRLTLPRTGARAAVIVVNTDGSRTTRYVTPNQSGDAVRLAGFGRGTVARVHLVLSNGSTSTDCWTRVSASTTYSCLGTPTGDNRRFGFKAELVR